MNKYLYFFFCIALSGVLLSQPTKISYQGVLTDDSGTLINGTKNLVFRIYTSATDGTLLTTDTHNGVSVSAGLFNVELNVGSIDFTQSLWLEIQVESTTLSPRVAFNASGYALAGKATSLQISSGAGSGKVLTSDANGNASWQTPSSGGLTNFTESNYTFNSKTGVKLLSNNAATNVDVVFQPKGTGAVLAQQPDGTTAGGSNRGSNAVDLQTVRNANFHVASGTGSVIMGGSSNTASGNYSTVSGIGITVSGSYSTAFGSGSNVLSNYSFAVGKDISANGIGSAGLGYENTTMGNYNFVAGIGNVSFSDGEAVLGKYVTTYTTNNDATDRIFAIGNGTSTSARSNALTILKNGNTTINGNVSVVGTLSLGLETINQTNLSGATKSIIKYTYDSDPSHLPSPSGKSGQILTILNSSTVGIQLNSNNANLYLKTPTSHYINVYAGGAVQLISDGTNWYPLSDFYYKP